MPKNKYFAIGQNSRMEKYINQQELCLMKEIFYWHHCISYTEQKKLRFIIIAIKDSKK